MKIKDSELYRYLDIILLESELTESNSSKNILYEKYLNPKSEDEREEYFDICDGVVNLGVKLGYFRYISKETDWFDLTDKGILAKSKGGHLGYVDYIEQKESERTKQTIIAENYIGGNNNGIQASTGVGGNKTYNNLGSKKQKAYLLEKLSWIVGIIGGLILIYEFIVKK